MNDKTRLVVVRAGDLSLHERWLQPETYDCIIAHYGDHKDKWRRDDVTHLDIKGGKWDGIYQVFADHPSLLEQYQCIWMPDDDVEATPEAVEKMFSLHQQYGLKLSQPALSHDSYFSHFCLLQNPAFRLRYSNFVEIMMPCMSSDLLRSTLPFFENNKTGDMLDKIWHLLTKQPAHAAAILDEVQMRHTQPVDKGALDKSQREQYSQKLAHILPKRAQRRPVFYGGILTDGQKITGERSMAYPLWRGWRQARPKKTLSFLLKQIRYQLTQRADLSSLL